MEYQKSSYEDLFELWIKELERVGIVEGYIKNPETFTLYNEDKLLYSKQLKTKVRTEEHTLFRPITYTPDAIVFFSEKYLGTFFDDISNPSWPQKLFLAKKTHNGNYKAIVDIKSEINRFGQSASDITFPLKQKMMWHIKGLYVNKVLLMPHKPNASKETGYLFGETFIPNEYMSEMIFKKNGKKAVAGTKKFPAWNYRSFHEWFKTLRPHCFENLF